MFLKNYCWHIFADTIIIVGLLIKNAVSLHAFGTKLLGFEVVDLCVVRMLKLAQSAACARGAAV